MPLKISGEKEEQVCEICEKSAASYRMFNHFRICVKCWKDFFTKLQTRQTKPIPWKEKK